MIVFSGVSKQFGPDAYGLRSISFQVAPGELVVITGPSGSGKTTLMRLLTKEYAPTEGDILFQDVLLNSIKPNKVHEHRRKIGVIFQDYKLLPEYNVWENIALPLYIIGKPLDEIESRVTDLLKLVNLVDKAFHFPSQLSGGEAQRVGIARALATGPSVIFADEPTGNLDPDTSVAIAQLLTKINELGTTVLLATHDLGVLSSLPKSRRLHIEHGQLTSDTSAKDERSEDLADGRRAAAKDGKPAAKPASKAAEPTAPKPAPGVTEPTHPNSEPITQTKIVEKPKSKGFSIPLIGGLFKKKPVEPLPGRQAGTISTEDIHVAVTVETLDSQSKPTDEHHSVHKKTSKKEATT